MQFRDKVNENDLVYHIYRNRDGKDQWSIICSAMDWMPGAVIRSGAKVHRAIIGENSIVGEGSFVGAERRPEDGEYNTSLTDDITLIASDTEIEAGRRVPVGMIVNATRKEA